MNLEKLVSGGQTGADRAALDVAIAHGFPHGGWCPKGRKAEDGPIPAIYQLEENANGQLLAAHRVECPGYRRNAGLYHVAQTNRRLKADGGFRERKTVSEAA